MTGSDGGEDGDENEGSKRRPSEARARVVRWLALCSPLVVPWVVVRTSGTTLVFPWGMVWLEGGSVVPLREYLGATAGLPRHLRLWPVGTLCYGLGMAAAAGRRFGVDRRLAAGLLALAGIAAGWVALGTNVGPNRTAVPVGSPLLFALAAWLFLSFDRDDRAGSRRGDESETRRDGASGSTRDRR